MPDNSEMHKRLVERLGDRGLEARVAQMGSESGGLLDEEAILALIADEQGLAGQHFSTLAELTPDEPVSTRVRIDAIEPARTFQGRERAGRLRKLRISDTTATMVVTLWDEEVEMVEKLGLGPGSMVRILSATLKQTRYGPEIHVGRSGFMVPEEAKVPQGPPQKRDIKDLDAGRVIVKGVILSLEVSGRGRNRSARGRLFDGTGEVEVLFSEQLLDQLCVAKVGTEMELSGAETDSREGRLFLRCDMQTRIRIL